MQDNTKNIPEIDFYKRPDEVLKKTSGKVNINCMLFPFNTYEEFHQEEAYEC